MNKNSTARIAAFLILFALASVAAFMTSCDGGGGGGGIGIGGVVGPQQSAYDIQITGPSTNGAQVNRPFSMTVNFLAPGTATPINVLSIESLVVSKLSGPGSLTGTLQLSGNGTSSLTFNNLILDTQGAYTLQVNGARATAPAVSATFNVGPQMDLKFTVLPTGTVYRPRTFSVTVGTVDPGTQAAVTPTSPIDITIVRNPASGTGTLGGTTTRTLTGTSTVAFPGLTYSVNETVSLQASAFGFASVLSNAITFDSLVLANPTVSASPLINGNFSITCTINSATTATPVAISPSISVSVAVASGGGTLTGTTTGTSAGSSVTVSGLRYSNAGPATFTVSSTEATSVTTGAVTFGVALTVAASGPTTVAPGGTPGPFVFSVRDGQGALYTGAVSQLAWALVNTGSAATVQSGNATFSGGNANVTLAAIATAGNYRLDGSITSPTATPNPASINITVSSFTVVNAPGAFVALKSVHVGSSYSDSITSGAPAGTTGYGILSGSVPAGLTLSAATGAITGTPTATGAFQFTAYAQLTGTNVQPIRCALAVFSVAETEITNGQSFCTLVGTTLQPGPYGFGTQTVDTFTFTSSFDGVSYAVSTPPCRLNIWYPTASAPTPWPLYIHHRGQGFNVDDYNNFGKHMSSYGILYVSVEDYQSIADRGGSGGSYIPSYVGTPELGMESCSAFQEAALNRILARNTTTGDLFYNKVDTDKVIVGGHSRGGGATHATHQRQLTFKIRGVIYYMPYDLRATNGAASGSPAPVYAIATNQPRLPSLFITAENDGDLNYPVADEMVDRCTGPCTQVCLWGGCHDFFGDTNTYGIGGATITRPEQMQRMFHYTIAFFKRWVWNDLSVEGILYGTEYAGSMVYGVQSYRSMMETIKIDDFQDVNAATNLLGGANALTAGSRSEATIYPVVSWCPGFASLGIKHNQITLPANTNATYSTTFSAQDASKCKRVSMRIGQGMQNGYDWVTVKVRLTDSSAATFTVTAFDRTAPSTTYLPDYGTPAANNYDRFVDLMIPLANFTGVNKAAITKIEIILESDGSTATSPYVRLVYLDDLRFD